MFSKDWKECMMKISVPPYCLWERASDYTRVRWITYKQFVSSSQGWKEEHYSLKHTWINYGESSAWTALKTQRIGLIVSGVKSANIRTAELWCIFSLDPRERRRRLWWISIGDGSWQAMFVLMRHTTKQSLARFSLQRICSEPSEPAIREDQML